MYLQCQLPEALKVYSDAASLSRDQREVEHIILYEKGKVLSLSLSLSLSFCILFPLSLSFSFLQYDVSPHYEKISCVYVHNVVMDDLKSLLKYPTGAQLKYLSMCNIQHKVTRPSVHLLFSALPSYMYM